MEDGVTSRRQPMSISAVAAILIYHIGKKVKLLLHHKQQCFEPQTNMVQGEADTLSMDIELTTFGQLVLALAN